jgi:hypothetical protein
LRHLVHCWVARTINAVAEQVPYSAFRNVGKLSMSPRSP